MNKQQNNKTTTIQQYNLIQHTEELKEWRQVLDHKYQSKSFVLSNPRYFDHKYQQRATIAWCVLLTIPLLVNQFLFTFNITSEIVYAAILALDQTTMFMVFCAASIVTFKKLLTHEGKYYFNQQAKLLNCLAVELAIIALIGPIIAQSLYFLAMYALFVITNGMMNNWIGVVVFPLYKIRQQDRITNDKNTQNLVSSSTSPRAGNGHGGNGKGMMNKNEILVNILTNEIGFESFMEHLNQEFASENLLFIVYLIQFQMFLFEIKYLNYFTDELNDTKDIFIIKNWKLPQNVPKSDIFDAQSSSGNNNNDDRVGEIFEIIYEKFIVRNYAPLEVNISHQNRLQIAQYYASLKINPDETVTMQNLTNANDFIEIWKRLRVAGLEIWRLIGFTEVRYVRPKSLKISFQE